MLGHSRQIFPEFTPIMNRYALLSGFVVAALVALTMAGPAVSQQSDTGKKKAAHAAKGAKEDSNKPLLVASFGDWGVYQTQAAKGRVCYTLAQPKDRTPADLKRDPAYAFISDRPSEGVRNEVSFIMGFDVANGPDDSADPGKAEKPKKHKGPELKGATAVVGDQTFDLLAKSTNLWVKNAAKEGQLVDEMRKGSKLEIRAMSTKGNVTTDTYSLAGFSQALERVLKDCPAGK
jgi:invasion protein IalB